MTLDGDLALLVGDPSDEADSVFNTLLDRLKLGKVESAGVPVGAVVELAKKSHHVLDVGVDERGQGLIE